MILLLLGMMERKPMGQPISLDIKIAQQGSTKSDTKFRLQVRTAGQHQIDLAIFLDSGCCLRHMSTHWKDLEVYFQMDPTPLQNSTGDVLYRPEDIQTSSLRLTAL